MILAMVAAAAFLTESDARRIQRRCHTPSAWIALRRDGTFRFKPAPDGNYEKIDCVLRELNTIAVKRGYRVGFIGNERLASEKSE